LYKIEQPVTSKDPTPQKPGKFLWKRKPPFGGQQAEKSLSRSSDSSGGGWTTTSTANKLADERHDSAVVAVLAPTCVEKFEQSGDARWNLAALIKISPRWEHGNFMAKGGWGNTPRSYFF
jgi:hypothetical protein